MLLLTALVVIGVLVFVVAFLMPGPMQRLRDKVAGKLQYRERQLDLNGIPNLITNFFKMQIQAFRKTVQKTTKAGVNANKKTNNKK